MISFLPVQPGSVDGRRALGELTELLQSTSDGRISARLQEVAAWLDQLEQDRSDLETLLAITVEASTTLENELSLRYDAVTSFLASTSHELRTPLHAVIGHSELLLDELSDQGIHHHDNDLRRIRDAGYHLLTLVNGILDLSKVESGRFELCPEPTDVGEIVTDLAAGLTPVARTNGNELIVELGHLSPVVADRTRVRQCLLNLLGNALKFTREGRVKVVVDTERDGRGRWVVVTIEDTGIGMTEDQLTRVFRPYAQAHAGTAAQFGGTGLGLALTKSLCDRMGAELAVRSHPGAGSTFTIRLPERPPAD